jgi:hypothetical protein
LRGNEDVTVSSVWQKAKKTWLKRELLKLNVII